MWAHTHCLVTQVSTERRCKHTLIAYWPTEYRKAMWPHIRCLLFIDQVSPGRRCKHTSCLLTARVQESDVSTHSLFYWPSEYRNAMWASREESVFLCWLCISSSCCWVLETLGLSRVNNSFSSCFVKYLQFKLDSVSHCLKITYQSRLWNAHKVYTVHVIKSNLYWMHASQNSK